MRFAWVLSRRLACWFTGTDQEQTKKVYFINRKTNAMVNRYLLPRLLPLQYSILSFFLVRSCRSVGPS